MYKNNELFALPAGPAELCFDKNEFMKKTFSVDDFLHEHRNAASLEIMRDDLGIYLKILRSAMIELINEDYADFVNLSSNLVGLDNSIQSIQKPLEQIKDDIMNVKCALTDSMNEINECLNEKRRLRSYRKSLQSLCKVRNSIKKLEDLLDDQIRESEISPVVFERAALELIQLKFHSKFCSEFLNGQQVEKSKQLHENLLAKIKSYFLSNLRNSNVENLERCLRIYATLDEFHAAEESFREDVVAVYMNDKISETALQNSTQGVAGIYNKVLDFIALNMKDLLLLTHHTDRVKGFDFLLNSFWIEVEKRLESHMSSIFAPGNPDAFYSKYKCTVDFLERIEIIIGNEVNIKQFRNHSSSKRFQSKWNLPVYFQIRFQEIAGALETACGQSINTQLTGKSINGFKIQLFQSAYNCALNCWSEGTYLQQLFQKFWKLTLQICSRVSCWIEETIKVITHPDNNSQTDKMELLVGIQKEGSLFSSKFPEILKLVETKVPVDVREHLGLLEKSMNTANDMIHKQLHKIEKIIVKELVNKSFVSTRHIGDIPRLYRKTNRDIPTKQCTYVEQMLEPLQSFRKEFEADLSEDKMVQILRSSASTVNVKFFTAVTEVLTSVQKTEESLRRLKNLREKTSTPSQSVSDRQVISDDDKIRLQLQVDILYWTLELEKMKISQSQIEKLSDLLNLIEDVTKAKQPSDK